ncbi:MAG TPA: sugar ABC transporter substrate-binding protein [Microlunatus sp.]|nr:sugar ABC transporter substrate-binding protein [Microlunatus sp.]
MRFRSLLTRLTVAVGALTLAAACGAGGETPGGQTGESWSIPDTDPEATINVVGIIDPESGGMNDVVDAFQQEHPSIKINYQYVPFDDLNSVLDSRITQKTGDPDVFWVDQPRVAALATRGYLEDLTDPFAGLTEALQPVTVEASSFDGRLYSLPIANSTQLLFYNKDLLDAAGVEPPSTDPDSRITWQQLRQAAKTAQEKGGAQYGLLFGQPDRYYQVQPLPYSAGGGVGATGDGNLTPDVANDGWVEAMTYYGSLYADKITPRGIPAEQIDSTFLAGKTAFLVEGNWMVGKLADSELNWGAALHPVWQGGEAATPTGSWSVGINPFSKNKEAAAIFLRWLAIDGESGYAKYRAYAELPANSQGLQSYLKSAAFTDSEGGKQSAQVIEYETQNTAVGRVSTAGYIEFEDILGRAFSDIANGADPKQALDSAQSQLETAWQQYR